MTQNFPNSFSNRVKNNKTELKTELNKGNKTGFYGETTTNDPERGGASGVQPTEEGTRHPATH